MTWKVLPGIFHTKRLRPFAGQTALVTISRVEADDVVMGFDVSFFLVLMITGVELLTFNIKGKRITVDAVHIIFFTHNLIAIPVKNGLLRFLVVLKQQIFQSSTVIRIFTCDVFQNRHGNHLPSE